MGRGEVHTGFLWGNLREGDHLEGPGVDGRYFCGFNSLYLPILSSRVNSGEIFQEKNASCEVRNAM
jgi:hypothetical protein